MTSYVETSSLLVLMPRRFYEPDEDKVEDIYRTRNALKATPAEKLDGFVRDMLYWIKDLPTEAMKHKPEFYDDLMQELDVMDMESIADMLNRRDELSIDTYDTVAFNFD